MSPVDTTNKLWNYCNVFRDDGMSCGDYVDLIDKESWSKNPGQ